MHQSTDTPADGIRPARKMTSTAAGLMGAILLAVAAGSAHAQSAAPAANAAPAPVSGGASPAAKTADAAKPAAEAVAQPGWFERQWTMLSSLFSPPNAARGSSPGARSGPGSGPPPAVTASRPLAREIVEWDEYTGRFDAVDTVDVRARVSGYLVEAHFKDGQAVKKGDLLYTIDARPFERALDQAKAELALANTRIENAFKDVDRARPLVKQRVITEKTFDDRENLYNEAQAQAKVAEARVKTAELDLSFTRITAPQDGRIGRSSVSVGNYIVGGAANGTLLTSIVSQDPIHLYFDVSENNLIKYKRLAESGVNAAPTSLGLRVELALPSDKDFGYAGSLDFIDNRLDAGTGTLRLRALVPNSAGLFSPGMFARVRIPGSARYSALMLPDEAIGTDQTNRFVYVVDDDGTAQRRSIELGPVIGGLRVVRSGLAATDWVIVRGVQRARPGLKVAPKKEPLQVSAAPTPPPVVAKP